MEWERVAETLASYRFNFQCEDDLQQEIASALESSGITFQREVLLSENDRVDFLVGKLGIEVKIKGSSTALARQINRYVQSELVDSILVVTAKASLRQLPPELNGKLIKVLYLNPL